MSKGTPKFITSHRSRVKRAEEMRKWSKVDVSIIDREAYVEFFLLEDIVRLYEYRLKLEQVKKCNTRAGEMARLRNIEKFTAVKNIFTSIVEIADEMISAGNYEAVWSSIPEHALMTAANGIKYLPKLRELAIKILRRLSDEALEATQQNVMFEESLDEIEDHDANVRSIKGLPSRDEIDEVIRAIEVAIPDEIKTEKKPNINVN